MAEDVAQDRVPLPQEIRALRAEVGIVQAVESERFVDICHVELQTQAEEEVPVARDPARRNGESTDGVEGCPSNHRDGPGDRVPQDERCEGFPPGHERWMGAATELPPGLACSVDVQGATVYESDRVACVQDSRESLQQVRTTDVVALGPVDVGTGGPGDRLVHRDGHAAVLAMQDHLDTWILCGEVA